MIGNFAYIKDGVTYKDHIDLDDEILLYGEEDQEDE